MNQLPGWVQWVLVAQTVGIGAAGIVAGLLIKSTKAGVIAQRYINRLETLEAEWQNANPRLSNLSSRVQGMKTVEELRDVFVSRELAADRMRDFERRLGLLEELISRDPHSSRTRRSD